MSLDTAGDFQLVVPLNSGAVDTSGRSFYISRFTQASNSNTGFENVALFGAGGISLSGSPFSPSPGTAFVGVLTPGSVVGTSFAPVTINGEHINLAAFGGLSLQTINLNALKSIEVWGDMTMANSGTPRDVIIGSFNGVITQDINTAGNPGGAITIGALNSITTGNLATNGSGVPGSVSLTSILRYITTGNISVNGSPGNVVDLTAAQDVSTGDILTSGNVGGNVSIVAGNVISTGTINSSSSGSGGNISLSAGDSIAGLDIVSTAGSGTAGSISMTAPDSVSVPDFISVRAISANNNNGFGGSINVATGGSIAANDITSAGSNRAGDINLTSSDVVYVGNVSAAGVCCGNSDSGSIKIIGAGLTLGSLTASSLSSGAGGSVVLLSSADVSTGDILTRVTAGSGDPGGDVIVVSTDGAIKVNGAIATTSLNNTSGSVSLTAKDEISVNGIRTFSPTGAVSGNIFVSSGGAGLDVVSLGIIDSSSANAAAGALGQIFIGVPGVLLNGPSGPTAQVSFTTASNSLTQATPTPYLFYSGNSPSAIAGGAATTLRVRTDTGVNVFPGGYATDIGASGNGANISFDFNGDSRIIVPIISRDNIYLANFNADNTGVGTTFPYQNNGMTAIVISGDTFAGGATGITLSGNVTANPKVGGTAGSISLLTYGLGGSIIRTGAANISGGKNLTLYSATGNIGGTGPANHVQTTISPISVFAGDNIFLSANAASTTISLGIAGALNSLEIVSAGTLTTAGTIFGDNVNLQTTSVGIPSNLVTSGLVYAKSIVNLSTDTGNVVTNGTVFGHDIVTAVTTGAIEGSGELRAEFITLTTAQGGIDVTTFSNAITADAPLGNVTIVSESPNVALKGTISGQTIDVSGSSNIFIPGAPMAGVISGAQINISTLGNITAMPLSSITPRGVLNISALGTVDIGAGVIQADATVTGASGAAINISGYSLKIDGTLSSRGLSGGSGGPISLTSTRGAVNAVSIDTGVGSFNGGDVTITAANGVNLTGSPTSIFTNAGNAAGHGGYIQISTGSFNNALATITVAGQLSSGGGAAGGVVSVLNSAPLTVQNNITVAGGINTDSQRAGVVSVRSSGSVTLSTVSADGAHGADIYVSGYQVATSGIATFATSGSGGNVVLIGTTGGITVSGPINTSATNGAAVNSGGNVTMMSANGITVTGGIQTSAALGSGGYVIGSTGAVANNATVSTSTINTSGTTSGGLVMLVNSALETGTTNMTVGNITTDATGQDGKAGPVSLVSSGGIIIGDIFARATNGASTSAKGGSVFISSGSTSTAVGAAIDSLGTSINTSATAGGANRAGNIILLSRETADTLSPANIDTSGVTISQAGGIVGDILDFGKFNAPATVPGNLVVTTDDLSINIRPGGYQAVGASTAVSLDTGGDTQMVVPINSGAAGALLLSSLAQVGSNKLDNVAVMATGGITIAAAQNADVTPTAGTDYFVMMTPGAITNGSTAPGFSVSAKHINVTALGGLTFSTRQPVFMTATGSLTMLGLLTNQSASRSEDVVFESAGSIVSGGVNALGVPPNIQGDVTMHAGGSLSVFGNIGTSGGDFGGDITLTSTNSYIYMGNATSARNIAGSQAISAKSYVHAGNLSAAGPIGSDLTVVAGQYIVAGNVDTCATSTSAGDITLSSGSTIHVQNIKSFANNNGGIVFLEAPGSVIVGDIESYVLATSSNAGNVSINSGSYVLIDDVTATGGTKAGDIRINASDAIFTGNLDASGICCGGSHSGTITLTAGTLMSTGALTTTAANNNGSGSVLLTAAQSIATGAITTQTTGCCSSTEGSGNVVAVALNGPIVVGGNIVTTSTTGFSGSVSLTSSSKITVDGINTSNPTTTRHAGNIFVSSGSAGANINVSLGTIDTSSASATAGLVGQIFIGNNVNGTNAPSAVGTNNISFTLASVNATTPTPSPFLFFDGNPSTITTNTTLSIKPGTVSIFPGVYTTDIGSAGTPVTLTFDLNGDSRTIVPIVSTGNMFLNGINASNAVGGSLAYQNNGFEVVLATSGASGIVLSGEIFSRHTAGGSDGTVGIYGFNTAAITRTSAVGVDTTIGGSSLNLYSTNQNIGTSAARIAFSALSVNAFTSGSGDIFMFAGGTSATLGTVVGGDQVDVNTNGHMTVSEGVFGNSVTLSTFLGSITGDGVVGAQTLDLNAEGNVFLTVSAQTLTASNSGFGPSSGNINLTNVSPMLNLVGNNGASNFTLNSRSNVIVPSGGFLVGSQVTVNTTGSFVTNSGSGLNPTAGLILRAGTSAIFDGSLIANGFGIPNNDGGDFFIAAPTIVVNQTIFANGSAVGDGGSITLVATNGSADFGSITMPSSTAISAQGLNGGNVTIYATNGINISGTIDARSTGTGVGGNVQIATGNIFNSATLTTGNINTGGSGQNTAGGQVMLVNSALASDQTNLTVGSITTSAAGLNGIAGPVSLVSGGTIDVSNITAQATNPGNTAGLGGGIFISSGSLAVTAVDASGATFDTSVTLAGAGNRAGNVILLSAAGADVVDPANILQPAFVLTGGTPGVSLAFSKDTATTSNTIPSTVVAVPNAVSMSGAGAIRPGGYQQVTGTVGVPVAIALDTGNDTQMVVPLNTGAFDTTGNSLYVTSLTQASNNNLGVDNLALVTAGGITMSARFAPTPGTAHVSFMTPGAISISTNTINSSALNVSAKNINMATFGGISMAGGTGKSVTLSAANSLSVWGNLSTSSGGVGGDIALHSGGGLFVQGLTTSGCCSNPGGNITLNAIGSITAGNITSTGGGIVGTLNVSSATNLVVLGNITFTGTPISTGGANIAAGSLISTGNITIGSDLNMSAGGVIAVGDIATNNASVGGDVAVYSGSQISLGNVTTTGSSTSGRAIFSADTRISIRDIITISGNTAGDVTVTGGSFIALGDIRTNSTGASGGDLRVVGGSLTQLGSIDTSGAGVGNSGNVDVISEAIHTGTITARAPGLRGDVTLLSRFSMETYDIFTTSTSGCCSGPGGGNVVALSMQSFIEINGSIMTNGGSFADGGSVSLTSPEEVAVNGINTSSGKIAGNIFVSVGALAVPGVVLSVGVLDTSSALASSFGNIWLGADVAGTNGQSAVGTANISFSTASSNGVAPTPNPFLFFNTGRPTSIVSDTTLQVTPAAVTIKPGAYNTIGTSLVPVSVTLDLGGDSRTLVPIVSAGDIFVRNVTADNTVGGAQSYQKNGYDLTLISNGNLGTNITGSVTANHQLGGVDGDVSIISYGFSGAGGILQTGSGVVSAENVLFYAQSGDVLGVRTSSANISAFTSDVGDLSLEMLHPNANIDLAVSGTSRTLQLLSTGHITNNGVISGGTVSVHTTEGSISGSGLTLADTLSLHSGLGAIVQDTFSSNLTVRSNFGNVEIRNISPLLTFTGSSYGAALTLTNSSDILVGNGAKLAGHGIELTTVANFRTVTGAVVKPGTLLKVNAGLDVNLASGTLTGEPTLANTSGANLFLSGNNIKISGTLSTSGTGTGSGGAITLFARAGSITTGDITSGGASGGNITMNSTRGLELGNINTAATTATGTGGYVMAATGNSLSTTRITAGSITTTGGSAGGLVLLVNSSANTASTNLTVSGTITTDASGLNGRAGPVTLVSSGAIDTGNISAQATNAGNATGLGGGIFISSGGTGTTAIDATGNTFNTAAAGIGAGNEAGNVILLSRDPGDIPNPSNIGQPIYVLGGGTPGVSFAYGKNPGTTSNTVPTTVTVVPNATINIRPGGYQQVTGTSGSHVAVSINTQNDSQMVVPINIGAIDASGNSWYLGTVSQTVSGQDNIVFVTAGGISGNGVVSSNSGTPYVSFITPAGVTLSSTFQPLANNINLAAIGGVTLTAHPTTNILAANSLAMWGNFTNAGGGIGGDTFMQSGTSIITQGINAGACCGNVAGDISLIGGTTVITRNLVSSVSANSGSISVTSGTSNVLLGSIDVSGSNAGAVRILSGGYATMGDITNNGTFGTGNLVSITAGSYISAGDILSSGTTNGGSIVLSSGSSISLQTITATGGTTAGTVGLNAYSSISVGNMRTTANTGGAIALASGSSILTGNIVTSATNGNSGNVTLTGASTVATGALHTFGANGASRGGALSVSAGSSLTTGAINSNGFGQPANGGNVNLLASGTVTVLGDVTLNSITGCCTGSSGGTLMAVSVNGDIAIKGGISATTTQPNAGVISAGSVSLTAAGTITATSVNVSGNGVAGNIFASSGSAASPAISLGTIDTSSTSAVAGNVGSIFLGANVAGTNGLQPTGNANISFTRVSTQAGTATPSAYLFYNDPTANPSTIRSDTTIQVNGSGVNIFPGVYKQSVGLLGTPVNLTLDLGGDSRTVVPIVSAENMYLNGFNADNATAGGPLAYQTNGYRGVLVSGGLYGITLNGNVTAAPNGGGTAGSIRLQAFGAGSLTRTGGSIAGSSLTLFAGGNINNVNTNAPTLSAFANGNISVATTATVALGTSYAGVGFSLTSTNSISTTGNISSGIGGLSLTTGSVGGTTLVIGSNTALTSGAGDLALVNNNTTNGTITIGPNSTIVAPGSEIRITIGTPAKVNTVGPPPSNFSLNLLGSGLLYYGTNNISTAAPQNSVSVGNDDIQFSTNTLSSSAILLNGGVAISNASSFFGARSGSASNINSLDLKGAATVSALIELQQNQQLGGAMVVNASGATVGGNLTFTGSDTLNLTALNIPKDVLVTMQGFQGAGDAVTGTLTAPGVIDGTVRFLGNPGVPSSAIVNLNVTNVGDTAITIAALAGMVSDGDLTVTSNGDFIINGGMSAAVDFDLTATSITGTGMIAAQTVDLVATAGSIEASPGVHFRLDPLEVTASATDDVFLINEDTTPVTLGTSSAGDQFEFLSFGPIITTGTLTADDVSLESQSETDSSLTLGGDITAGSTVALTAETVTINGDITVGSPTTDGVMAVTSPDGEDLVVDGDGTGTITASQVNFSTLNGSAGGSVTFQGNPQTINGDVNIYALAGQVSGVFVGISLNVNGNIDITADATLVNPGAFIATGNIVINFPRDQYTFGTIINTQGDVVLGPNTIINANGRNVAILASGNVEISGLTKIDLSSKVGQSGNLSIFAGFTTPLEPSGVIPNTDQLFRLGSPSETGGDILWPKLSINTSNANPTNVIDPQAQTPQNGGNVLLLAAAGTDNSGLISVGSINTTSKFGSGGSVELIGEGGVVVNGTINTSGAKSAGSVSLFGAPTLTFGQVGIFDGYVLGGIIQPGAPPPNSGSSVQVNGNIVAVGTTQRGGNVFISADRQIEVKGTITTTGLAGPTILNASGSVVIESVQSSVNVTGIINTSGAKITNAANGSPGADAGDILIHAGTFIRTNTLNASGGTTAGSGGGGDGGNISLTTNTITVGVTPLAVGVVEVKGFINAQGGAASKTLGNNGGAAGNVTVDAAKLVVTGSGGTPSASILASGGIAGSSGVPGADGQIDITTYAIQPFPSNLDLTSTAKKEAVLPGGMFTIGVASPVNGVAGKIISGTTILTKNDAPTGIFTPGISPTNVTINVVGGPVQITENSALITPQIATAGKRTFVTPAEAVALYQVSHNETQTINLGATGATTGGTITVDEEALISFTGFKLPAGMTVNVTGDRPILNLPSATLLDGTLNFVTPGSTGYINFGTGAAKINGTIAATAGSTLFLSSQAATITVNGVLEADTIILARPKTAPVTYVVGQNGVIRGTAFAETPQILIGPSVDAGISMTFKVNGGALNMPINFGDYAVPNAYSVDAAASIANEAKPRTITLSFATVGNFASPAAITPVIGGTLSATDAASLTIKTATNKVNNVTLPTTVRIDDNADLAASKTIAITSVNGIEIGDNVRLTAGVLKSTAPSFGSTTLLAKTDFTSTGTLTLTANGAAGITIGNGATITNNGLKYLFTTKLGDITFGDNNTFTAMGGNIQMLSKFDVVGGAGNAFQAKGMLTQANGGIEIGSGTSTSTLTKAFGLDPGTSPAVGSLGASVVVNNPAGTGGGIFRNVTTGGNVDLGTATLNLSQKGGMSFDSIGATSVTINGGTFTTKSDKPISFNSEFDNEAELLIESGDDATVGDELGEDVGSSPLSLR
jgi:fibronectin-binding autotransporter adhesin